ncbi:GTPase ObgE [Candidatus Saccharibacteria bacterium]|nr:GTPase ObgE [Candidatus Saccharibacteria bacterium]
MFVDKVLIQLKAGDGGDGAVSFRHEIYVDKGGPDGGDGGDGGDIILQASRNQNTLAAFRFQKLLKAEPGKSGSKQRKHGRSGKDLIVQIPVGTAIVDSEGQVLADLTNDGQKAIVARGGKGGFGNAHFTSSTRQVPRVAEKGEDGDELELVLELKMIADVGLVGLPNAGKSTFLASISNARPEIADYPFTTLTPNLGVVDIGDSSSLLVADIPGIIEGASEGKGLGDEFLRHVERTGVLLHLIDSYDEDVVGAFKTIQNELKAYKIDLTKRPQMVVLTKIEGLDDEIISDLTKKLKKVAPKGTEIMAISSFSKQNIPLLLKKLKTIVDLERATQVSIEAETESLPVLTISNEEAWHVEKTKTGFVVTGKKIERFAHRTDFESFHGTQRLRDIMKKMGIMHGLIRDDIEPGDKITIGNPTIGKLEY